MFQQVCVCEWCLSGHALKHTCGQHILHARQGLVDISVARDLAHLALFPGSIYFTALPKTTAGLAAINLCLLLPNPIEAEA